MVRSGEALLAVLLALGTAGAAPAATRDPASPPHSPDEEQARIAKDIEGFGGLYFDGQGRPTAYVLDPGRPQPLLEARGWRVVQGDYSFLQLRDWRLELRSLLALEGVVLLDLDEARNRVRIGVDEKHMESLRGVLLQELALRSVPEEAVLIEPVEPVVPVLTLQQKVRPVPGGFQINYPGFLCTLGFNAFRSGSFGFVTNSHCTSVQGGVENTRYYQAVSADGAIGTETADPTYFSGGACPAGRVCRYSDSAFARYDSASLGICRQIARTTFRSTTSGSLTIDSADPRFVINGKTGSPVVGQELNKVGRTTGWTYGPVTATCVDTNVFASNVTQLCQHFVNAGVGGGDSGSPVFSWPGGSTANLHGILWGASGSTTFVFSSISSVESELGGLPCTIQLSGEGTIFAGKRWAFLNWSQAPSASVDVFRDGVKIVTTANDGQHTDSFVGSALSANYWVCDAGSTTWYNSFTCSNVVTVTF